MRERNLAVLILVMCLTVVFVTGCCSRKAVKSAVITGEQMAAEDQQASSGEQMTGEQALKEQALKEQTLKEQALKEQAAKEQAAKEQAAKGGMVLADILFDFDEFSLKPEARGILEQHAKWLLEHKNDKLTIEGHSDERGTTEYNLALGERRATAAMKYLVDLGIDEARLRTISYGEELPLDPGHDEAAWAKNRRDHFVPKK